MDRIKGVFDTTPQSRFWGLESEKIQKSGLFLNGVGTYATRNLKVATRVLREIEMGRVDIFCQERIFSWLDKLRLDARNLRGSEFSNAFYAAMSALRDKTDARFSRRGYKVRFNNTEASAYSGYGNHALISHGLTHLRFMANREGFKHLAYRYGDTRPVHQVDFPAKVKIRIRNPKYPDYADDYVGRFIGGGSVTKIKENLWELSFDDYYLATAYEHLWSRDLWLKIFSVIQPYASQLFLADVFCVTEDQFND